MKQTDAEIVKDQPVQVHPKVIMWVAKATEFGLRIILFTVLLSPWCLGWKLVTGGLILAWFSQQLNNLKK